MVPVIYTPSCMKEDKSLQVKKKNKNKNLKKKKTILTHLHILIPSNLAIKETPGSFPCFACIEKYLFGQNVDNKRKRGKNEISRN